ncbi:hypothetical protein F5X71_34565 [Nocardia brasiliensis]|uniref:Uncharacterized protein n=1 Tax=Nocardia brasiliensis TaxID=37326 RepID=A0A6G9Y0N9_NOCBR|nr:hypothetical protein [Nocardia brasiliensis]QIS06751.1 hypothetical protein F5X71_34565 [Nocardia brasiliensis]
MPSPQFMQAFGTALGDLIGANIADAITQTTGGIINLRGWATQLRQQAADAINKAIRAQATADTAQNTANAAHVVANGKPSMGEIPLSTDLWKTLSRAEQSTFPRTQLSFGSAPSTASGGSQSGSHSHTLNRVPDYQPSGNGTNYLELGFIRVTKDCALSEVGFISGNSQTFAGINGCYLGVFKMDTATGALTLLNPGSATVNIANSVTTRNTEHRFSLGVTINARQHEIYAIGVLQQTGLIQTAAALMCTTLADLNRSETAYPRKNYAYAGTYSAMPAFVAESDLNYDRSTKLPFFYLREAT